MPRGRPVASQIRQNIMDMLYYMKHGHGYEIYKKYIKIFPKATMRSIYYNLKKGSELGEFQVKEIKKEQGEYSWGEYAEKTIYALGPKARPLPNKEVEKHFKVS